MQISHSRPAGISLRLKKEIRNTAIADGFDFELRGVVHTFQTDLISRTNVSGRVGKITARKALGLQVEDFTWRNSTNDHISFTANEFLLFGIAMDEFIEQQYQDSWS